ncbi:CPBP family intramembrane metalloprotease [Macrococcus brunensis]|uniref:CPBP family intramembrane metalloprotease n=2 Tax=Macrococcus brunensis TaxID=198483 RepID=A0A4R6BAV9_9STAP|nr:CPBP family intramembrane metalloprotease [Macrococcus brunensis]
MVKINESIKSMKSPYKWWSVIMSALAIYIISSILTIVVATPVLLYIISIANADEMNPGSLQLFFVNMLSFPIVLLLLLIFNRFVYQHSERAMGFFKEQALKKYLMGVCLGIGLILLVFLLNYATGAVAVRPNPNFSLLIFVAMILCFMVQGLTEEVLARGFIMNKVAKQLGLPAGIIINSLFFAGLHLLNPGVTAISTYNIFLAGVLFSLLFYWSDNIWLTGATHSVWNIMLGVVLGSEVSGMHLPSSLLITTSNSRDHFLNGGHFGLEGGIFTTLMTLVMSGVLIMMIQRKSKGIIK